MYLRQPLRNTSIMKSVTTLWSYYHIGIAKELLTHRTLGTHFNEAKLICTR